MIKYLSISNIKRISFRSDINGLRAIAVLGVVFFHANFDLFQGGWLGVDIFFVISGYLISNIIISELNAGKFTFRKFYLRRVRRILPGLFSTLLLTIPFSYLLLTPKAMIEYTKSLTASIFFYANYYFENLDFYNAEPTKIMPLLHTWSLAIEEQFYIIFPLLCFILFKIKQRYFSFILGFLFLFSIYLNSTTAEIVKFYQIQYRAWELILGALVMVLQNKVTFKHIEKLGLGLVFFSMVYFDDSMLTLNSIEPRLIANIGVASILFSNEKGYVHKFLSSKYLSIIGLSSYSIYLFHQPLFAYMRIFQRRSSLFEGPYLYLFIFILLFLSSYLNWKYVEIVFQQKSINSLLKIIFIVLVIMVLFIFLSHDTDGFADRYDYVPEEVLFYSMNPNIYPTKYDTSEYKFLNTECDNKLASLNYCIWFNEFSEKNIYLIGDSQNNALSVSFLIELESLKDDYNLIFMSNTVGRCLLSQQSDIVGEAIACQNTTFNEFLNLLDKEKDIVISFGRFNTWLGEKGLNEIKCDECDYVETFKFRLEEIAKNSSEFYIVEPIPTYSFGVAESYLYKNSSWGEPITLELSDWKSEIGKTESFLNNLDGENISLISTIPLFCDPADEMKCYAADTKTLYYSDSNHLTLEGANLITNKIELELNKK